MIDFKGLVLEVEFFTFSPSAGDDYHYENLLNVFFDFTKETYKLIFGVLDEKQGRRFLNRVGNLLVEQLMNCAEHGNKWDSEKKIYVGCWFGAKGLAFCFQDEGGFFSRPEIKKKVWHRTRIYSDRPPGGGGTKAMYFYASKISLHKNNLCLLLLFDDIFKDF